MKNLLAVLTSAAGALVLTLVTVVATLLSLMFSTGDELVHKVGLFGSLFFQTTAAPDGATGVTMGVEHLAPLVGVFAGYLVALLLAQFVHRQWRSRRRPVVARGAGA